MMNGIGWSRGAACAAVLGAALVGALAASGARADETGRLTTHVLDTANGKPAAGMGIDFYRKDGASYTLVASTQTNKDGRTDKPLMVGEAFKTGSYQIVFHVAAYYRALGAPLAEPAFLDTVPVQFSIADGKAHYHVPLLTTPWSYATYRGS